SRGSSEGAAASNPAPSGQPSAPAQPPQPSPPPSSNASGGGGSYGGHGGQGGSSGPGGPMGQDFRGGGRRKKKRRKGGGGGGGSGGQGMPYAPSYADATLPSDEELEREAAELERIAATAGPLTGESISISQLQRMEVDELHDVAEREGL